MEQNSRNLVKETLEDLSNLKLGEHDVPADSTPEKDDDVIPENKAETVDVESAALNDDNTDDDEEEEDDKYESAPEDDGDFDEECRRKAEENMSDEEKQQKQKEALDHKSKGNDHFKEMRYSKALNCYNRALQVCPMSFTSERAIVYANKAACFQHLDENDDAIAACTKALDLNPAYIKARLRRANMYEKTEKLDEALEDYKKILEYEPLHKEAFIAARDLPERINERNEKLKAEMLGKLKDLGNMVLRPFGLSTENFKLQQDPNTGGYSVNFQQNAPQ